MMLMGNCESSDKMENSSIISIPKRRFKIHCCQSLAGFHIILQKCGTTMPMNKIGPRNAVTEADNKEEAMITKYFS